MIYGQFVDILYAEILGAIQKDTAAV